MRQAGIDNKRLHRIIESIQQDVDNGHGAWATWPWRQ